MSRERAEALMVVVSPLFIAHREPLAELCRKHRLPRTVPRAAIGTYRRGSVRNNSTVAIAAAATSPITCVRPPAAAPIAVRLSAPVTANPCERAEGMLAAP